MKKLKNPILILILCGCLSLFLSIIISYINYVFTYTFSFSVSLLVLFVTFVSSFLTIYFIYNAIIFAKIDSIYNLIKRNQPKEIPNTQFQLDEVDSILRLEEEIKKLTVERQKEAEQHKNLDSYRKEFLGNVSHELKTPVFNIQGYVSTLIDGGIYDEDINLEYLKRADKSVDRMIQIIDDLETISQLEIGDLELDIEKYDIVQQIKDVIEALELEAKKQDIRLQLSKKQDKSIYVKADKYRIRQVLFNLITNSIKYGTKSGKTNISINLFDNQVIVEIKDNGIGIAEKHLPRLFERFYRVDKGRSREQGGTGLGLAIVKHIIEAHHQTIDVISKVNQGTTISFTLARQES